MLTDGLAPYIPHLDAYLTLNAAANYAGDEVSDQWRGLLEWDLEMVVRMEAFFRLDGESKGADLEMTVAAEAGIPIFCETEGPAPHTGLTWEGYPELLSYAAGQGLLGKRKVKA
jgi:hypothetical protein